MSGLFSFPQCRTPPSVCSLTTSIVLPPTFFFWTSLTTFPPIFSSNSFRFSGVPGSSSRVAISAALHAASGRRAGQMWSVEICPCRTFFSWTESRDACLSGNATSMRRGRSVITSSVHQLGSCRRVIEWLAQTQVGQRVRAKGPPLRISLPRNGLRRSFNNPATRSQLGFEPNFSTGVLDSAEQVVAGGDRVSDVLAQRPVNAPRTRRDLQSVKTVQVGDKITKDG